MADIPTLTPTAPPPAALQAGRSSADDAGQSTEHRALRALLDHAVMLTARCENADARRACDEVRERARARGWSDLAIRADAVSVALDLRAGDPEGAMRRAMTTRAAAEATDDAELLCHARLAVARVDYTIGENDQALAELELAWPTVAGCADPVLRFHFENTFGIVCGLLGQIDRSIEWHHRARETARSSGLDSLEAMAFANAAGRLIDIGERAWSEGRHDEARQAWRDAVTACDAGMPSARRAGARSAQLVNLANRTAALAYLGEHDAAMAGFPQVDALAAQLGDPLPAFNMWQPRAAMLHGLGDLDGARAAARQGVAAGEQLQVRTSLAALYELLSALEEEAGDLAAALAAYRRFHRLSGEMHAEQARLRSQLLSVRLQTERALADAEAQRRRAQQLQQENEALGQLALQDGLTGLANRRRLDAELAHDQAQARVGGRRVCLALLDVDHFKQVNDRFSHLVGDRVLARVGELLRQHSRERDLSARYGGEEFALLIRDADIERARRTCERLRLAIADEDWSRIAPGLAVTASLGVADLGDFADAPSACAAVDTLLYAAKHAGRNRVVASPTP